MAGMSSGPSPWWTQGPNAAMDPNTGTNTLGNLQKNAPPGYTYDPVKMQYIQTPQTVGGNAGTAANSFLQNSGLGGALGGLQGAISGTTGGGTAGTGGTSGTAGTGGVAAQPGQGAASYLPPVAMAPHAQMPDTTEADQAIFDKAKDTVGQSTQGALTGLRSALGGRGMLGSGAESRGTANVITTGQGQLGQTARDLATQRATENEDIAKTNYTGDVTQRGQDVTAGTTQRGQDIQSQEAAAQLGLNANQFAAQNNIQRLQLALQGLTSIGSLYGNATGGAPSY
jgi:hypothetical protein